MSAVGSGCRSARHVRSSTGHLWGRRVRPTTSAITPERQPATARAARPNEGQEPLWVRGYPLPSLPAAGAVDCPVGIPCAPFRRPAAGVKCGDQASPIVLESRSKHKRFITDG